MPQARKLGGKKKYRMERAFTPDGENVVGVGDFSKVPLYFGSDFIEWIDLVEYVVARNRIEGWN